MTKILTVSLEGITALSPTYVQRSFTDFCRSRHSDNPWYKNKFQIFIAYSDNPFQSLKAVNIRTPNDPQKTYPQKEEKKMIFV